MATTSLSAHLRRRSPDESDRDTFDPWMILYNGFKSIFVKTTSTSSSSSTTTRLRIVNHDENGKGDDEKEEEEGEEKDIIQRDQAVSRGFVWGR